MSSYNQTASECISANNEHTALHQDLEPKEHQTSLLDVAEVLVRRKKLLLVLPAVVAMFSIAISFLLPSVYKATTKLVPPQQSQSGASALLAQIGGVTGLAGVPGMKNPNDLYIGMLKSRTVADKLIDRFDLKKAYDTDSRERARAMLESATTITAGKDGLLTIEVEDRNQKFVAKLANAYVDELLNLTKILAVTDAAQRRVFYERQLELAKDGLAKAEVALKSALDAHGVFSVDAETQAVLETSARLKAQVSAKEIQMASMRSFLTEENPEFKRAEAELHGLQAELSRLETGRSSQTRANDSEGKQRGFDNIQLMREVKYRQMLYETLAKQFEIARIEEAKDPSVVQVLDPAVEPERRARPKRAIIVAVSTFAGLLLAIAWALIADAFQRSMSSPESATRWRKLKKQVIRN